MLKWDAEKKMAVETVSDDQTVQGEKQEDKKVSTPDAVEAEHKRSRKVPVVYEGE